MLSVLQVDVEDLAPHSQELVRRPGSPVLMVDRLRPYVQQRAGVFLPRPLALGPVAGLGVLLQPPNRDLARAGLPPQPLYQVEVPGLAERILSTSCMLSIKTSSDKQTVKSLEVDKRLAQGASNKSTHCSRHHSLQHHAK